MVVNICLFQFKFNILKQSFNGETVCKNISKVCAKLHKTNFVKERQMKIISERIKDKYLKKIFRLFSLNEYFLLLFLIKMTE